MWPRRPGEEEMVEMPDRLREQIRLTVRDEIDSMLESRDGELEDLSERIDFAERLLIQARLPEGEREREPTPV
jgi:hypothetical protein